MPSFVDTPALLAARTALYSLAKFLKLKPEPLETVLPTVSNRDNKAATRWRKEERGIATQKCERKRTSQREREWEGGGLKRPDTSRGYDICTMTLTLSIYCLAPADNFVAVFSASAKVGRQVDGYETRRYGGFGSRFESLVPIVRVCTAPGSSALRGVPLTTVSALPAAYHPHVGIHMP